MEKPVRKLNKKHIYLCMLGLFALSLPAIFSLASHDKKSASSKQVERGPQVNSYAHDTKTITGTEHFPETYGDVKSFEQELALKAKKQDAIVEALATREQKKPEQRQASSGYRHQDDPWLEEKRQEQKQRAQDNYNARHSEIMFINNIEHKQVEPKNENGMVDFMDKAMAMAQSSSSPNDMLLIKNTEEKDPHRAFLNKNGSAGQLKNPSKHMISEGTLINATLLSEINTDLPGPILARVSHNIWDSKTGQTLLIPQNSKLIGEYNSSIGNGQSRAQIVWNRIIYPNQQSVDLGRMIGVDKKGVSGSAGIVDNHYDKVALTLLMTTALGAGVRMTQGKYDPNSASMGQELGNSLAQETARLGNKVADKILSIKPTITVAMGERLNVFVEQDLHLEPYSGQ